MSKNGNLHNAKTQKNDEFYTQYEDIQKELNHYEKHFKGKVVLCNCDDPFESNFAKFFLRNFNYLGLKRLICTSYSKSHLIGKEISIFDLLEDTDITVGHGYVLDVSSVPMKNGRGVSDEDIDKLLKSKKVVRELKGDGDFRSPECIEYLKQSDIVVTNPPFSLFREYVSTLMEYNKQFIIIGNMNATNYLIPYMRDNKIWVGVNSKGGTRAGNSMHFRIPDDYTGKTVMRDGVKMAQVTAWWFTNLDHDKRHEKYVFWKEYSPEEYPKYDNYNAIDCGHSDEVPKDYYGVIGVPISFLNGFYCPEQFDIIGITYSTDTSEEVEKIRTDPKHRHIGIVNGKEKYPRILIRRKQ